MSEAPDRCPKCGVDFDAGPIPDSERRYKRVIGVVDPEKDALVRWRCPDCGHEWKRSWRDVRNKKAPGKPGAGSE